MNVKHSAMTVTSDKFKAFNCLKQVHTLQPGQSPLFKNNSVEINYMQKFPLEQHLEYCFTKKLGTTVILVWLSCYDIYHVCSSQTMEMYLFLKALVDGKSNIKMLADQMSGKICFLSPRGMSVGRVLKQQEREGSL